MREEAFRRFLAPCLGACSIVSYLSNLRRVERVLRVDVDALALDDQLVENVRERLRAASVNDAKVSDCLSALRAYAALRRETVGTNPLLPAPSTGADCSPDGLASMTTAALLANYAAILRELRARRITRTGNGPVGDYAEHLFSRALGWTLEPNSNAGFDARDPATRLRYEVKARRLTSPNQSAHLSALRGLPERRFDLLAVLLFAADLSVATAALIPHELVLQRSSYVAHTNSWRLVITPALLAQPGIEDVTMAVRAISGRDVFTT